MSAMANSSAELTHLLCSDRIPCHLKYSALKYILGLSVSECGLQHILMHEDYLKTLFTFLSMDNQSDLCETAHKCFINISTVPQGAMAVVSNIPVFSEYFISMLDNRECPNIELKCQVLSNVTRYHDSCQHLAIYFLSSPETLRKLLFHFIYNDMDLKSKYDYLGLFFGNLSTCAEGKRLFLNSDSPYLKYVLPYTTYPDSDIRRMGAAMLLRNLCFEIEYFRFLLEEIDILPALLLPLAGPEEYDDEEMEKLPIDLQYLGEDKQREDKPQIRMLLLESILRLCTTTFGRMYLRDKGVYYILRELHNWETWEPAIKACEDIVEILIRDECDIETDNLMEVAIPEHLTKQFEELSVSTSEIPEIVI